MWWSLLWLTSKCWWQSPRIVSEEGSRVRVVVVVAVCVLVVVAVAVCVLVVVAVAVCVLGLPALPLGLLDLPALPRGLLLGNASHVGGEAHEAVFDAPGHTVLVADLLKPTELQASHRLGGRLARAGRTHVSTSARRDRSPRCCSGTRRPAGCCSASSPGGRSATTRGPTHLAVPSGQALQGRRGRRLRAHGRRGRRLRTVHVEEECGHAVVVQRHSDDRGVVVADTVKHVRQTGDGIIS